MRFCQRAEVAALTARFPRFCMVWLCPISSRLVAKGHTNLYTQNQARASVPARAASGCAVKPVLPVIAIEKKIIPNDFFGVQIIYSIFRRYDKFWMKY
jgi:hypothetical protein